MCLGTSSSPLHVIGSSRKSLKGKTTTESPSGFTTTTMRNDRHESVAVAATFHSGVNLWFSIVDCEIIEMDFDIK